MKKRLRVLFISGELIAGDLAYRLKKEGCDVRLYIKDSSRSDCFDGMVEKTDNWEKELDWVGRDGLIVFDDVGYGKIQDNLREKGYNVVGGSEGGDKLELDRDYGHKIFSTCEVSIVPTKNFSNIEDAIDFVKKNKGKWVIKQNDHQSFLNYVGHLKNGNDVISVLKNYKKRGIKSVNLQEKIDGIEIGVARYFNGNDWVGPIEFNIEHKDLYNDNIGPKTGEMGTIMWYSENENNKIYEKTLKKLKPFLIQANFKGDIDINCIVSEKGIYPIEATSRFGCPAIQLQMELHNSTWKEFLMALAKGEKYDLKYKKEIGIIVSICIPPFPYKSIKENFYLKGMDIYFEETLTEEDKNMIHFEEVSFNKKDNSYCIAGSNGFILYIAGSGRTLKEARNKVYSLIKKISIPQMFYRTDIGLSFINKDEKKLKKESWI